jgi:hypothetical protein
LVRWLVGLLQGQGEEGATKAGSHTGGAVIDLSAI